jgi:DNA polymerase III subunit gamma/tau
VYFFIEIFIKGRSRGTLSFTMAHQTFYRKYRSATFSEMVGQEHIIRILQNAVRQDQLAHAYIFSGPRGTGKTSAARILAKALNCVNGTDIDPCGTCVMCQKIAQGQSVDVIEIDAASHNGVDHIRALTEQVYFAPVECQYKIYIIDEVHMLSTGAFNALLKTLEEPPSKVLFILATTELHKIPATVLSRCQHLNFRRLGVPDISKQLAFIAKEEGFSISADAQTIIARQADGCMRDAVSLLEQVLAFEGQAITAAGVGTALGGVEKSAVYDVAGKLFAGNPAQLMTTLQTVLDSGMSASQLVTDLIDVLRNALLVVLGVETAEVLDPVHSAALKAIHAPLVKLQAALQCVCEVQSELRFFPNPGLLLQVKCLGLLTEKAEPVVAVSAPAPSGVMPISRPVVPPVAPSGADVIPTSSMTQMSSNKAPIMKETPVPVAGGAGLNASWAMVVQAVKDSKHALFAILNQSEAVRVTDTELVIRLKQDFRFFREKLAESSSQAILKPFVEKAFGKPLKVQTGPTGPASPVVAAQPKMQPLSTPQAPAPLASSDAPKVFGPVVDDRSKKINHIVAMFDGAVVDDVGG